MEPSPHIRIPATPPRAVARRPGSGLMSPTDAMMSPVSRKLMKRRPRPVKRKPRPGSGMNIVLGSGSEARQKILESLGCTFVVERADIDEPAVAAALGADASAEEATLAIAKAKADVLAERLAGGEACLLVTADQVVRTAGERAWRGKPEDAAQAVDWVASYSGKTIETVTAVVVTQLPSAVQQTAVDVASIEFGDFPRDVAAAVVAEGVATSCCGALVVESVLLEPHIVAVDGQESSLLGLPRRETVQALDTCARLAKGLPPASLDSLDGEPVISARLRRSSLDDEDDDDEVDDDSDRASPASSLGGDLAEPPFGAHSPPITGEMEL
eukprot:PLAT7943.1.p1 GENE.PLAT7943.1~~PLAT7943.1.p1  ORF type:complete len:328 (-),score=134.38 PLAT7943.1:281-1264(-)